MADTLFWTLDDYKRFIEHDEYSIREWATYRIRYQYPEYAAEAFAGLLTDPTSHLRILAAQTLGRSGDPRYEPALRAALPDSTGNLRHWIIEALGQLRSQALLPQWVAELDATGADLFRGPDDQRSAIITALGYYPDPEAQAALWRFVDHYPQDDRLANTAFDALLRHPEVDTVPRLVRRRRQLTPASGWANTLSAFSRAAGVSRLAEELTSAPKYRPDSVWDTLRMWLDQPVIPSITFEDVFDAAVTKRFAGLLPHIAAEIKHVAEEQEDDLEGWQAAWAEGQIPTGYRWRMTYSDMLVSTLAEQPSKDEERYLAEVGLGLALLGQVLTDYDDEGALRTAPDEEARQAVLLEILSSARQNVMPNVAEQVAALGPAVVPDLIAVLEDERFWAQERALIALKKIAQAYPEAVEAALPAVLRLIHRDQGDFVLEAASDVIRAIGSAAVEPAAARLGQVDYTYDIYVVGALSEIPAESAVDALLAYIDVAGALGEMEIESLTSLGHRRAMPVLRSIYQPGDPLVARALYIIGLLNGYTGPEMDEWRAVTREEQERFNRILDDTDLEETLISGFSEQPDIQPEEERQRKKQRKKSGRKESKKRKRKRRRRRRRK